MIGKTILHYKILKKLGAGGMGVVYKAGAVAIPRSRTWMASYPFWSNPFAMTADKALSTRNFMRLRLSE
jgi:serine/threonine protein kinase